MPRITPAQAVEAIRDFGVEFRGYGGDDWHTFTTAGGWDPVGVCHHHTGGSKAVLVPGSLSQKAMHRLLRVGRSDLDGPLCHFAPTYMGRGKRVVYGIGWRNTNHAGLIARNVADALRTGSYRGAAPGPDAVDGNALLYGLEYLHPGDGTPWPDELLDTGHRVAAALCEAHGWNGADAPGSNAEHREVTRRKPDRSWSGWGDGMRSRIAAITAADEAATGWVRPAEVQAAMDELAAQARKYEEAGREARAKAARQERRHLADRWPTT